MSRTAKAIIAAGAIATAAGIGYAVYGHRRDDTAADTAAGPTAGNDVAQVIDDGDQLRSTPLPEPEHPRLNVLINRSRHRRGIVVEGANELWLQARKFDPDVDLDELAGARLAASEHHSGTFTELACIVDAELNRAERKGQALFFSLTDGAKFGKQGGKRPASTRLDPRIRHLLASRAVQRGEARGISRGATLFCDPESMDVMHAKYRRWVEGGRKGTAPPIVSCDALTLLEAWSFDYGKRGKSRCPPDRSKPGRHPLAWVGPIPGVDPLRLLLMKPMPLGPEHTRRYEAARAILLAGLRGKET